MPKRSVLIIFLLPPYPPRRDGLSLRYYPLIKELSKHYEIDAAVLDGERVKEPKFNDLFRSIKYMQGGKQKKRKQKNIIRLLQWLNPLGLPVSYSFDVRHHLLSWWDALAKEDYTAVIICSAIVYMPLLNQLQNNNTIKLITDLMDSPYLLQKSAFENARYIKNSRVLHCLEMNKTKRMERKIINQSDRVVYISNRDGEAVISKGKSSKMEIIPNIIQIDDISSNKAVSSRQFKIGFLGNYAYKPNEEAVLWLLSNVLDSATLEKLDIEFFVIGKNASEDIISAAMDNRITITGEVSNHWEWLNSMDLMLQPIFRGSGVQNKIVESMYIGKPVITNSLGNGGLEAEANNSIIIANSADEMIGAVQRCISDPGWSDEIGANGLKFVHDKFGTENVINRWLKVINQ